MSAITIDLDNDLFVVSTGMMRQCLLSTPTIRTCTGNDNGYHKKFERIGSCFFA